MIHCSPFKYIGSHVSQTGSKLQESQDRINKALSCLYGLSSFANLQLLQRDFADTTSKIIQRCADVVSARVAAPCWSRTKLVSEVSAFGAEVFCGYKLDSISIYPISFFCNHAILSSFFYLSGMTEVSLHTCSSAHGLWGVYTQASSVRPGYNWDKQR